MTPRDAINAARSHGVRFELDCGSLVLVGQDDAIHAVIEIVRPHRDAIRAILEEHDGRSASDAVLATAALLRHGLWPKTSPRDCGLFIGPGTTAIPCRRCGLTWHEHHGPMDYRPRSAPIFIDNRKKRGAA